MMIYGFVQTSDPEKLKTDITDLLAKGAVLQGGIAISGPADPYTLLQAYTIEVDTDG